MSQGLVMTFIEAPLELQKSANVPQNHYDVCKAAKLDTKGNAAASTDWLNLSEENKQPDFLPEGFTARGIVALVFSFITAILGMCAITWYGLADVQPKAQPESTVTVEESYRDDVN